VRGSVQRHETSERDPTIVVFDRYAFDLSRFAGGSQTIKYSVRERYLWELLFPDPYDPLYQDQPGQFRAELHDRLIAPLYPLAMVLIVYAYLGAPRTTRQSRGMSVVLAVGGVATLRIIGFASTIFAVHIPLALLAQYGALIFTVAFGVFAISRGMILEPPVFITNAVALLTERISRRVATT